MSASIRRSIGQAILALVPAAAVYFVRLETIEFATASNLIFVP